MKLAEQNALALLFWHLDASDSEMRAVNVTREDILRLARSFEAEISDSRRDQLTDIGRSLLLAYRHGQMDGPRSVETASVEA
jgi:hypothetical protein